MAQTIYTFTGADGTVDSSFWTDTNSQGLWSIASNKGKTTVAATQEMKATAGPPEQNYAVTVNFATAGSGAQYLVVWARMTGADGTKCGYKGLFDFSGATASLTRVTNNADVDTICTGIAFNNAVNHPVGVLVRDSTIALYQDGAILSGGSGTNTVYSAAGSGGIGLYNPANDMRFTNFVMEWSAISGGRDRGVSTGTSRGRA